MIDADKKTVRTEWFAESPERNPERRTRVLFIGGCDRSGSTLLARLLASAGPFVACGEIAHFFQRGVADNQLCGCGLPLRECEFWRRVVAEGFGGFDAIDPDLVHRLRMRVERIRRMPFLATRTVPERTLADLKAYQQVLGRLFRGIAAVAGDRIVVDTSKSPAYGWLLGGVPGIDVASVHLIRDSRAVAYSWRKVVTRPEVTSRRVEMPRRGSLAAGFYWVAINLIMERVAAGHRATWRVRYEDVAAEPDSCVERLCAAMGLAVEPAPTDGTTWRLAEHHTAAGNPMRFRKGPVKVEPDLDWRSQLPPRALRAVTLLTWPLLVRYGYLQRGIVSPGGDEIP